eukprot:9652-Amphidinium_carterae.2
MIIFWGERQREQKWSASWLAKEVLGEPQRLLTGFGLDFLAEKLSGPTVDRATLQLIGVLLSSILLPGLAS